MQGSIGFRESTTNFVQRENRVAFHETNRIDLKKEEENIGHIRGLIVGPSFLDAGDEKQRNIPSRKSGHSPPLRSRVLLRRTVSRHPASSVLSFSDYPLRLRPPPSPFSLSLSPVPST